jgi:hypothetical protein
LPPMDAHHPRLQPSCRATGVRTVPPNHALQRTQPRAGVAIHASRGPGR